MRRLQFSYGVFLIQHHTGVTDEPLSNDTDRINSFVHC